MAKLETVGVCLHPEDTEYSPKRTKECFCKILELGANAVRTDIPWKDLFPRQDVFDKNKFDFYQYFWSTAQEEYGLEGCAVLSRPPEWTRRVDRKTRLTEWQEYCKRVAEIIPRRKMMVQLTNEGNNPFYGMGKDNTLLIETGSRLFREAAPRVKLMANFLVGLPGSKKYWDKLKALNLDMVGIDYYQTYGTGRWKIVEDFSDTSAIIAETGESSFHPRKNQQSYFWSDLWNKVDRNENIRSLYIYELVDNGDKRWRYTPEGHFGLLKSDLSPKNAWYTVKNLINS